MIRFHDYEFSLSTLRDILSVPDSRVVHATLAMVLVVASRTEEGGVAEQERLPILSGAFEHGEVDQIHRG